jgi:hypothetical protein
VLAKQSCRWIECVARDCSIGSDGWSSRLFQTRYRALSVIQRFSMCSLFVSVGNRVLPFPAFSFVCTIRNTSICRWNHAGFLRTTVSTSTGPRSLSETQSSIYICVHVSLGYWKGNRVLLPSSHPSFLDRYGK